MIVLNVSSFLLASATSLCGLLPPIYRVLAMLIGESLPLYYSFSCNSYEVANQATIGIYSGFWDSVITMRECCLSALWICELNEKDLANAIISAFALSANPFGGLMRDNLGPGAGYESRALCPNCRAC